MAIKIKDNFEKIGNKDIAYLESFIGLSLPSAYKTFLLKYNGGRIEPIFFKTANDEIESGIHFIFGITEEKNYDLLSKYKYWIENIHLDKKHILPIAIDFFGNLILIDLLEDNQSVYLWVHDSSDNSVLFITKGFKEFLNCLYKVEIEQSSLDIAIARQDIEYFNRRISQGEKIDSIRNQFNQPAIIAAALTNKVRLLKYFYENGSKMEMALFSAASNGHYDAVKYLLSVGLNPDERDASQNNDTALIQAAFGGYLEVVKELVDAGADINAKDTYGQSVLRKGLWSSNIALIDYLEKLGATV